MKAIEFKVDCHRLLINFALCTKRSNRKSGLQSIANQNRLKEVGENFAVAVVLWSERSANHASTVKITGSVQVRNEVARTPHKRRESTG